MKNLLLFCILLVSIGRLSAQVTVEVSTDQDEFLPGEDIPVVARIVNHSGETLKLGNDNEWLKFSVAGRDGYVVLKTGEVPVTQPFTLESSERATVHANLAPYFHLPRTGHYLITATLTIPGWSRQVNSSPKGFDVIQGARLWQEQFGVPTRADNTNAMPETRTYALQEANYLHSRLMLYAQVADKEGKLNKVIPIGSMVSFGQPEPQVDKQSNLNVLYQNGPRTFNYTVIDPDGNIILRQTYDYTSRPRLMPNADGEIAVVGGKRRVTHSDLPPPTVTSISTNVLSPP
ncbi:MAG TPA: hypothetical protein VKV04_06300 [Verrucomicrobiae bacterium]|nr:hypothetical protein [Verrucomicrobiae bacterium]